MYSLEENKSGDGLRTLQGLFTRGSERVCRPRVVGEENCSPQATSCSGRQDVMSQF
jgi:hypothetical protein